MREAIRGGGLTRRRMLYFGQLFHVCQTLTSGGDWGRPFSYTVVDRWVSARRRIATVVRLTRSRGAKGLTM